MIEGSHSDEPFSFVEGDLPSGVIYGFSPSFLMFTSPSYVSISSSSAQRHVEIEKFCLGFETARPDIMWGNFHRSVRCKFLLMLGEKCRHCDRHMFNNPSTTLLQWVQDTHSDHFMVRSLAAWKARQRVLTKKKKKKPFCGKWHTSKASLKCLISIMSNKHGIGPKLLKLVKEAPGISNLN